MQLIDIMRFDDAGLVCEHWGVADMLSLMQQLGARARMMVVGLTGPPKSTSPCIGPEERGRHMWAQLIQMRLKPGKDTTEMIEQIRDAEQPGSGLVRSLMMRDQTDPSRIYTLVVFESEDRRAREQDPRRNERLAAARSIMADIFEGPPEFTDLEVIDEWTDDRV